MKVLHSLLFIASFFCVMNTQSIRISVSSNSGDRIDLFIAKDKESAEKMEKLIDFYLYSKDLLYQSPVEFRETLTMVVISPIFAYLAMENFNTKMIQHFVYRVLTTVMPRGQGMEGIITIAEIMTIASALATTISLTSLALEKTANPAAALLKNTEPIAEAFFSYLLNYFGIKYYPNFQSMREDTGERVVYAKLFTPNWTGRQFLRKAKKGVYQLLSTKFEPLDANGEYEVNTSPLQLRRIGTSKTQVGSAL